MRLRPVRFRPRQAAALLCAGLLGCVLTACHSGSSGQLEQFSQVDYAHGGTVAGVVHFTGAVPPPVEIDMAQDPVCAMGGDTTDRELNVNDGGLGGVVLYISHGLGNRVYPTPREAVTIDQKGCRFHPHISAVMVGQRVEFTNSDPTQHNIHMSPEVAGNAAFDISQGPHADPVDRYFHAQELMIPIRCNNHPWMHAYLNVLTSPFYAVSRPDGSFSIRGLPPGTYTLTAVQEKLGSKSVQVVVKADATSRVALSY